MLALEKYQNAKSISVFLSMPEKEASTTEIVLDALGNGKEVFVPYIYSEDNSGSKSMDMLQIADEADLRSLKLDPWGIPSLSRESIVNRRNALGGMGIGDRAAEQVRIKGPNLDLIFMPAVAFDRSCHRLGHGKGFYDRYLQRYKGLAASLSSQMPLLGPCCIHALEKLLLINSA